MKTKIILLLLSLLLLLSACKKEEDIPEDEIEPPIDELAPIYREPFSFTHETFPRIDGSPSAKPLAEAIASAMLGESRENITSLLTFDRTSEAFRNLSNDLCDIIIVGEPSPGVLEEISAQDFRYDMEPIALDALVFIVSSSNPVDNLTTEQIRSIYTGEITGWQQVGGDDIGIIAFQRNEEAMSQVLMEKLVMDWQEMIEPPMQNASPLARRITGWDSITVIKGFDSSVNAIGYTTYHYAVTMAMADGYKILSVDGVTPNADSLVLGNYPFVTPFYAVINKDLPEDDPTRILFNWLQAEEGQEFIDFKAGYIWKDGPLAYISWDVQIDDSFLTPNTSTRSSFNRLLNAALPELVPSDNYGVLLPYSTAVTRNDGSIHTVKYGFVAQQSGTVVTDPIYDEVERAVYTSSGRDEFLPVYHLRMDISELDPDIWSHTTMQAACAIDGSWITPFSYINIIFSEEVMLMVYDYSFNIDVYDYNGNLLYNILELDWADRTTDSSSSESFLYTINEGIGYIQLDNNAYNVVDIMTGELRETNFHQVLSFYEGLSAVIPHGGNNLWGFVNKDLEFVIQPAFAWPSLFLGNYASVETPDGRTHIINKQGEILLSVTADYYFIRNYDNYGFMVHHRRGAEHPKLLSNSLYEIDYPPEALPFTSESSVSYIGSGWYLCITENGTWLISESETISMPANRYADKIIGDYLIFREYSQNYTYQARGVMTRDGHDIIEADEVTLDIIIVSNNAVGFIINTNIRFGEHSYDFVSDVFTSRKYSYVDLSGQVIKSDLGILSYDEVSGLLYVQGTDYFAWINRQGETLISIPSMAYTFD